MPNTQADGNFIIGPNQDYLGDTEGNILADNTDDRAAYDFSMTRNQIVTAALRKINVAEQGQDPTATQISEGANRLNQIVMAWQNEGINLWTLDWRNQPLGNANTVIGSDGAFYRCINNHTSNNGNQPKIGPNWERYWYQDATEGIQWREDQQYLSSSQYTLPTDVLGIDNAFIRYNGTDFRLDIISRNEYMDIGTKYVEGHPQLLMYDTRLVPNLYLYPQADLTDYQLHYLAVIRLKEFENASSTPDFPQDWYRALVWGLAADLASEYGLSISRMNYLDSKADYFLKRARKEDKEYVNIRILEGAY